MESRSPELAWAALQIDDVAVLMRAVGLTGIADRLDAAHDDVIAIGRGPGRDGRESICLAAKRSPRSRDQKGRRLSIQKQKLRDT